MRRLRIFRRPTRTINGIDPAQLRLGSTSEMDDDLAAVLVAEGSAELVSEDNAPLRQKGRPTRVLVVDDSADLRTLTTMILALQGYEVVEALDGREALACLSQHAPDLIILDLNMPGMNGWQFRAEQQRLTQRSLATTPVLIVTGEGNGSDHATALDAAGFIKKPFHPSQLVAAVERVLHP